MNTTYNIDLQKGAGYMKKTILNFKMHKNKDDNNMKYQPSTYQNKVTMQTRLDQSKQHNATWRIDTREYKHKDQYEVQNNPV